MSKKVRKIANRSLRLSRIEPKTQVISKGGDYFSGKPELQASYDRFTKAQIGLEPYKKISMPEAQIRNLIHQHDIPTVARPAGVPENFLVRISKTGAGMEYVHPTTTHISVRVMPGKPHSPFPYQQKPYVVQMESGSAIDQFGNRISHSLPEAHIPLEEFIFTGIKS